MMGEAIVTMADRDRSRFVCPLDHYGDEDICTGAPIASTWSEEDQAWVCDACGAKTLTWDLSPPPAGGEADDA